MTETALRDPVLLSRPMSPDAWLLRAMILENDRRTAWFRMRDRIDVLESRTSHFAPSNDEAKSVVKSPNQNKTLGINSAGIGQASRSDSLTPAERTELSNLRRRMADEDSQPFRIADPRELEAWQRAHAGRNVNTLPVKTARDFYGMKGVSGRLCGLVTAV